MTIHTLFIAPNSSCEVHGQKLDFEVLIKNEVKHFFITDSGKLVVGKVLNKNPLVYKSVKIKNVFQAFQSTIDSHKEKLFKELKSLGKLDLFNTFEPIIDGVKCHFNLNYKEEEVTVFQGEKVHSDGLMKFYKSAQSGWYVDQDSLLPVLYFTSADSLIDGKLWYEHLPQEFQEKLKTNDLGGLYDFPFPKPSLFVNPTIPTEQELLLPEFSDCKEFNIHNSQIDKTLFGKQILLVNNGKWDQLNIIYTPKTKEFHLISDVQAYFVANSLAECIFHKDQEPYGHNFYEYYMNSGCEYALSFENTPVLKKDVVDSQELRYNKIFQFQSRLLSNERNTDKIENLPKLFGNFKKVFVDFEDHRYYGADETYIRHNAILKNDEDKYLLIRFSEYQVNHDDLEHHDCGEFGILAVGMTKLICFENGAGLLEYLYKKTIHQNDLKGSLEYVLNTIGVQLPDKPDFILS